MSMYLCCYPWKTASICPRVQKNHISFLVKRKKISLFWFSGRKFLSFSWYKRGKNILSLWRYSRHKFYISILLQDKIPVPFMPQENSNPVYFMLHNNKNGLCCTLRLFRQAKQHDVLYPINDPWLVSRCYHSVQNLSSSNLLSKNIKL